MVVRSLSSLRLRGLNFCFLLALLGLIACLLCFALVYLLGLLCVHYLFFFLCSAWLDRLRLSHSLVELASLARTDLDLASRLLRRLSLLDLLSFLLQPNFYGGPRKKLEGRINLLYLACLLALGLLGLLCLFFCFGWSTLFACLL